MTSAKSKRHIFKSTGEKFTGGSKAIEGTPIEACACGVKRLVYDIVTVRQTLKSVRLAKSESKLYWSQPFDKVTTKGGWEEKAPPCTR